MKKLLVLLVSLFQIGVAHAEVLVSCHVGSGPTTHVEVVRENRVADTWLYALRMNGRTTPVFSDAEGSRGSVVYARCVGKRTRAIVFAGEFSANALQGFVLTYDPKNALPGRLSFADKQRPDWVFLNGKETLVVVPTKGLGETSAKFRIYRGSTGENSEPAPEAANVLPSARIYEKLELR